MSLMRNKIFTALLGLTAVSFVAVGFSTYSAVGVLAENADRSKTIYQLEQELKSAEQEEKALRSKIASNKAKATAYENEIASIDSEMTVLGNRLAIIEELNKEWQAQQDETKKEIEELGEQKDDEIEAFEEMLKMSYTSGTDTYFNLIFGSEDIGDFLSRTDMISYHLEANSNILDNLTSTITKLESATEKYDESIEKLADYGTEQAELEQKLEERSAYAQSMKEQYEADAEVQQQLLDAKKKELEQMEAEIKRRYEESKKNGTNSTYTGGPFAMPLSSGTYRVSSGFEWRTSPISGKQELHNGLDLAAPTGTAIYAAASGTVIDSRYSNSWGNVIQIDHGGGVVTLYAHCSARLVQTGQTVSQGDLIGKVGCTGWSTGSHLHFTVYKNGTAVDPRGSAYLNF